MGSQQPKREAWLAPPPGAPTAVICPKALCGKEKIMPRGLREEAGGRRKQTKGGERSMKHSLRMELSSRQPSEESPCFLLSLEEIFCPPVPPSPPAHLPTLVPASLAHCTVLQEFLLNILGGVLSSIHPSAWRPDIPGSTLCPPWSAPQERRPAWYAEGCGGVFWGEGSMKSCLQRAGPGPRKGLWEVPSG